MSAPIVRLGILGAARIARLFIQSVRESSRIRITAVASRDVERARAFAQDLGVPRVHDTYDSLLADPDIDAIYNPLANTLHAAWSIRALDAGKHVLCEKPLAMTAADAEAMFAAAARNGVHLVEGYPYRAQPQTLKVRELLAQGAIGRLHTVHASFGFPLADMNNIRLNADLGGGALMDAGSYPVSFVRMVAGERPARVQAMARWTESGVDSTLAGTLAFPSGLVGQVSCSFATARHRRAWLVGEEGTLTTTYFNDTTPAMPPRVELRRGVNLDAPVEVIETPMANGFRAEADAFADLVAHGPDRWTGATPAASIDIAWTLEALARAAREGDPAAPR